MMKRFLMATALLSATLLHAQTKPVVKATPTLPKASQLLLKNASDSFSYAAGLSIAESMRQSGVTKLNTQVMAKAMNDVYAGGKCLLTKDQANMTLQQKLQEYSKKKNEELKAPGIAFLAANKKRAGIIALPNGLQYEIIKAGDANAPKPLAIDTVVVNYIGTLTDGTEFDNSFKRGQAITFPLGNVIRGWTEILQLMPKGSHWKVYIPSELGYGENPPQGSKIGSNAVLVFDMTLEDIKPAKNAPAQ